MNGSWKPNTEKYQANFDLLTVYNGDEKPMLVVAAAVARLSKEWRECYVIKLLMRQKIDVSIEQKQIRSKFKYTVPEMPVPKAIHVNKFKSIF